MNDNILKATLKVLIDGQAFLYAENKRQLVELYGEDVDDDQFQKWMDEYKSETQELIQEVLDGNANN